MDTGRGESAPLSPHAAGPDYPTTLWQRRYWRLAKAAPQDPAFNVAMRWRVEGTIADATLEAALQALIARHEILRTLFVETTQGLRQMVTPEWAVKVRFVDLQRLAPEQQDAELARIGREEGLQLFDLTKPGLLRALLVRTGPASAVLHLTLHHLIADGWSIGILIRELGELAAALDARRAPNLPDVDLHYADFALFQEQMLADGAFATDLSYWEQTLDGAARFRVPADNAVAPSQGSFIRSLLLPQEVFAAAETQARGRGQTLFSVAAGGLVAALHAVTEAPEIVLCAQTAGRPDLDAEAIVGPLINTMALRLSVDGASAIQDVCAKAMAASSAALGHQTAPFEALEEKFLGAGSGDHPLYPWVNFNLQRAYIDSNRAADLEFGRFRLVSLPSHSTGAQWDLNFFMVGREEGWRISCEANAARYTTQTVDGILALWRQALDAFAAPTPVPLAVLDPGPLKRRSAQGEQRLQRKRTALPRAAQLRPRILPLQVEGSGPAVMAVNITSLYFPLSQKLGRDIPFFDLRAAPAAMPQALPLRDFSDLAREMVEIIRLARPQGPYILMGLCVSGALALEAARQLREDGADVPLVVLNDTWCPGYREDMPLWDREIRKWQVRQLHWARDIAGLRSGEKSLAFVLNNHPFLRMVRAPQIAAALGLIPPLPKADEADPELRWFADYLAVQQARHRPAPYDGDVLVVRSEEVMTGRLFAREMGWAGVVRGRLTVVDCPGQHATMFRDAGAAVIAAAVHNALAGRR